MDVALVIRQRLDELDLDQRDLARAAHVTESYVSQILTRKKAPPAPDRTDIYDRMDRFLKLPQGELARVADAHLKDERKRELAACSGLILPLVEDALDRERYLFYASVSRATERVVLSYRSSDEEGNLELASPFISDVADLMDAGWRERRRRRLLGDLVWPIEEAPTDRERVRAHFEARCRAVVEIPYDPHLATGGRLDLGAMREETKHAFLELAAHIADEFSA